MEEGKEGLELPVAFLSGIRTDSRTGGYRITIDIFPDQIGTINAMALMTMYNKSIKVKIEELPK